MTSSLTLSHGDYTVGWICALPVELAAATAMFDEHHNPLQQHSRDHNTYTLGRIGGHNVVLACLPDGVIGTLAAARVADQMLQTFEGIKFGLMVGIGGGVPSKENDIRLGDIVVGKPTGQTGGVIQYDFGKTVQEGRFNQTGSLNRPPDVLLTALAKLRSKHMREDPELAKYLLEMLRRYPRMTSQFGRPNVQHDWLYDAEYDHIVENPTCSQCNTSRLVDREPRPSEDPAIHYGLIASGNQVMRHGATRERLRKELNVLCFEMEAAGLMNNFPCLVVRGICDYADSHKNKQWQGYAAAIAAAYAKELLSVISGNLVVNTKTYQGSEFEGESTIKVPKNSVSQINDQASDIVQLTSSHNLNNSSTNFIVASASNDKAVTLEGHSDYVTAAAFPPDGMLVASRANEKTAMLEGHSDHVNAVSFSPDGKLVASVSDDTTVRLWDSATGAALRTLEGHLRPTNAVAFSPDGKLVASGSGDKTVRLWNSTTGAVRRTLKGHSSYVFAVAFSPDGKLVASGSADKKVRLWDSATGAVRRTLEGHFSYVIAVAFSPDGNLVASGSADKTIRLWDSTTGAVRCTLEGHLNYVRAVAFSPDGKLVASGSDDQTVRLWDSATGRAAFLS
jgi:nucleoside phosphorylase/roadblock/LC7 domain-containing protein